MIFFLLFINFEWMAVGRVVVAVVVVVVVVVAVAVVEVGRCLVEVTESTSL